MLSPQNVSFWFSFQSWKEKLPVLLESLEVLWSMWKTQTENALLKWVLSTVLWTWLVLFVHQSLDCKSQVRVTHFRELPLKLHRVL